MKKSLVLAMAMALGVTASAYAANPFSDVPAGHWAYDSINKLAAAGVIDGYGDGTFGGDKLMTRYEMAQIVAKAMAKGASVERLAAEFADELDNLGVRVANLEKKADNVKITGELRFRYVDQDGAMARGREGEVLGNASNHVADLRSRIWVNGTINDDWTYTGMLQNTQNLSDNAGNEDTKFQRAYVDGKLGGMAVRAGRYNLVIADGNIYDTRADGLELSYGNKLKLKGFAGKATDDITVVPVMITTGTDTLTGDVTNGGKYWGLAVEGELAKGLKATVGYTQFKDMGTGFAEKINPDEPLGKTDIDNGIWHAGLSYDMGHFNLSAMYLKGDLSADKLNGMTDENQVNRAIDQYLDDDGFVIGLSYKGAKAEDAGSWGAWAKYYDQGAQTYVAHTTDANTFGMTGFKGFGVGANYTLAKNIVANVAYYNTESKLMKELPGIAADLDRTKDHRFWTDVTFTF